MSRMGDGGVDGGCGFFLSSMHITKGIPPGTLDDASGGHPIRPPTIF